MNKISQSVNFCLEVFFNGGQTQIIGSNTNRPPVEIRILITFFASLLIFPKYVAVLVKIPTVVVRG
jgi:hypothetical protein